MAVTAYKRPEGGPGLRLETLIRIRWLAVFGQTVAVFFVAYGLQYEFHLSLCLALIACSAWLNVLLRLRYSATYRLENAAAMALLGYDILQLALLLFLTGGLQNPFAILLVVPVIVSAATQTFRQMFPLGLLSMAAATVLVFYHLPLPWEPGSSFEVPLVYVGGMWVAIASMLVFTAFYTYRVAGEARNLSNALAATELVLQREIHLSTLDGLAAAAAHELGTPLATIALVSKEMIRELPEGSPLLDDARLLRGQADRCRDILKKLSSLSNEGEQHIGRLTLSSLMEEVAAPHRDFGVDINLSPGAQPSEPIFARNAGILYGLGNLVENAVDFAQGAVEFSARWDSENINITISDDGPGFPAELLDRIGEPYMTTRRTDPDSTGGGLGLGLFIAKTLLERTGAQIDFANGQGDGAGATIEISWARSQVDLAMIAADTDTSTVSRVAPASR
ncbi:MAG: ActS/PrrB/RegB family redox-sensitive histidine kinase [Rhizobiaceae bacterium]